jgi:RNA polymerase sigma-70 factor (ECF subfamily)
MPATDATLLERWTSARDPGAFRELVERYAHIVYATSRRILGDPARAEDVAQDCFLKLVEAPEAPSNLAAWLHRVARNRSLDLLRSEKRRQAKESRWAPPGRETSEPSWEEVEPLVDDAIDLLPEEQRVPVVLHFLAGRTLESIGSLLNISKSTVSYRIEKGIAGIRASLRKRGIGLAPAILAGWLSARLTEAAPQAFLASLGKMALAGPRASALPARDPSSERLQVSSSSPAALPGHPRAAWRLPGGAASLHLGIGAIIIAATVALVVLQIRRGERERREVSGAPAAAPVAARPAEPPAPAVPKAAEAVAAAAPAAEEPKASLASIAGTVVEETGAPVARAEVLVAFPPAGSEDRPGGPRLVPDSFACAWSRTFAAQTAQDGTYRLEGLAFSGTATVSAFREGLAGTLREIQIAAGEILEGVDLELRAGKMLRGVLLDAGGNPVTDAIVWVYEAWHSSDMAWPPSRSRANWGNLALTGERGRFLLGLSEKAETCHLRANSESIGQDFFLRVAVTAEEVRLQMKERAAVGGRVLGDDGEPMAGVRVAFSAEVPVPDIPIAYTSLRPQDTVEATPDAEGWYEAGGLQPGFEYEGVVVQAGLERHKALMSPLTPRGKNRFLLAPGEVRRWDPSVARPIRLRGSLRTERSETPLGYTRIAVAKDGNPLPGVYSETDEEGAFQVVLNGGQGRYTIHALPRFLQEEGAGSISERFGQSFDFRGGEEMEIELQVFEPIVLPVRVLDAGGKPVESMHFELGFTAPDGKRWGHGASAALDLEGRSFLAFHFPVEEIRLRVGAFPGGPLSEERTFHGQPGTVLPEETFVLERTCDIAAVLLDPFGKPAAEERFTLHARYADGKSDTAGGRTDRAGRLEIKDRLRAATMSITIRGAPGRWKGEGLEGSIGSLDLGRIVLEPEHAE